MSGDDDPWPVALTKAERAKLRIIHQAPLAIPSTPQLMALKQREILALSAVLDPARQHLGSLIAVLPDKLQASLTTALIEEQLALRAVTTPATGNCMAMAIVQALADHDLASADDILHAATSSLKLGIKHAGLLHMSEQFPHDTRLSTIVNVKRGWMIDRD